MKGVAKWSNLDFYGVGVYLKVYSCLINFVQSIKGLAPGQVHASGGW